MNVCSRELDHKSSSGWVTHWGTGIWGFKLLDDYVTCIRLCVSCCSLATLEHGAKTVYHSSGNSGNRFPHVWLDRRNSVLPGPWLTRCDIISRDGMRPFFVLGISKDAFLDLQLKNANMPLYRLITMHSFWTLLACVCVQIKIIQ